MAPRPKVDMMRSHHPPGSARGKSAYNRPVEQKSPMSAAGERDLADWIRIASGYLDRAASPDGRIFLQFTEQTWRIIGDVRRKRVLDLGCGPGWTTRALRDAGARVRGIEGCRDAPAGAGRVSGCGIPAERPLARPALPEEELRPRRRPHARAGDSGGRAAVSGCPGRRLGRRGRFVFSLRHPCFYHFAPAREGPDGSRSGKSRATSSRRSGVFPCSRAATIITIGVSRSISRPSGRAGSR